MSIAPLYNGSNMNRAELKLEHNLPFNKLSKLFPDANISRWCNLEVDILEIEATKEQLARIQKSLKNMMKGLSARMIHTSKYSETTLEAVIKCRCAINNSSISVIEASNCIPVMPVTYSGGIEHCKVLSFSSKDLGRAIDNLSKFARVEVASKESLLRPTTRSSMTISAEDFFGTLTRKQLDALVQSIEMGYYSFPKQRTIAEISSLLRARPSTFEEHLRKAEAKVMRSIIPYARIARLVSENHSRV
ncbi:MAG: helix-turn-helix domain-containing protein [Nitrososphaerota archaeon]|nr:helix-turn-helix domain-containing protein [Nitrososphaerota archaeon]